MTLMGKIIKQLKNRFYVPTSKTPTQLAYDITRIIVAVIFGLLGFIFSRFLYFAEHPLLGVPYTGGSLVGLLSFALIYFLTPYILKAVGEGISYVFKTTIAETMGVYIDDITKNSSNYFKTSQAKNSIPKVSVIKTSPVLLDTSSIIDARICGIIELGFLESEVIVPQFVIDELHLISDSKSKIKRTKGRRGLNVLGEIKRVKGKAFKIYPTKKLKDVDGELIKLAKKLKARIATVDFNLAKVALIKGIVVLNVNSLANTLKTPLIPGDTLTVKLIKPGKENGQAIGYLEDGTMILVNNGIKHLQKILTVEVAKILQTDAGQMIFCELKNSSKVKKVSSS